MTKVILNVTYDKKKVDDYQLQQESEVELITFLLKNPATAALVDLRIHSIEV